MNLLLPLVLAAQTIGPPAPPAVPASDPRAPMIGLEGPESDACGGIARVATYDAEEPVRERPQAEAIESDRLPHETLVWLCEGAGEWQGVVYPSGDFQELGDCGVSGAVTESRPYDGPCRSGWVRASNLYQVAG